jgi:hypothetical protein
MKINNHNLFSLVLCHTHRINHLSTLSGRKNLLYSFKLNSLASIVPLSRKSYSVGFHFNLIKWSNLFSKGYAYKCWNLIAAYCLFNDFKSTFIHLMHITSQYSRLIVVILPLAPRLLIFHLYILTLILFLICLSIEVHLKFLWQSIIIHTSSHIEFSGEVLIQKSIYRSKPFSLL